MCVVDFSVTGTHAPPDAGTRIMGQPGQLVARIVSSDSQAPPKRLALGAITWTTPLSTSTRFRSVLTENPTDRPSGDQNGNFAFSVPASGRGVVLLSVRSHKRDLPPDAPTNASVRPSGEIASDVGAIVAGVLTSSRSSSGGIAGDGKRRALTAATTAAK